MEKLTDINGTELDVGDLLLLPSQGTFEKAYLLGITAGGFYISTYKNVNKEPHSWGNQYIPEKHDSKKYQYRYRDRMLLQKNKELPEALLKVCNLNQLNANK